MTITGDRGARTVEDVLSSAVVESSRVRNWAGVEVMLARNFYDSLEVDGLSTHTLAINIGRPYRLEGRAEGRRSALTMGTSALKIVEAGIRSTWRWDQGGPIDVLHLSIDDAFLQACAADLGLPRSPAIITRVGFESVTLTRIARMLAAEARSPEPARLIADAQRAELLLQLIDQHSSLTGTHVVKVPINRLSARTLRRLDEFIETHLGKQISIDELANVAGISRFHFARVFRATVGETPHRYIVHRRLDEAYRLLRKKSRPLSEIALATGFTDQSHLSRRMKVRFGASPRALRPK